jgi:hypothetical protein
MYLQEVHWYALSLYLNPKELGRILTYSPIQSQFDFKKVQTQVILNLFKDISSKPNRMSIRHAFESLTLQGYLPIPPKGVSNSKFGYICNNLWYEWEMPSVEITRCYWDQMLLNVKTDQRSFLVEELQRLLCHLPNEKTKCDKCQWYVSENSMHDDQICIYCDDNN